MQFTYIAYSDKQGLVKGRVDAPNQTEARAEVVRQGYKLLRVAPAWHPPSPEVLFPTLYRIGTGEVVRFSRQMATMLGSGGSLIRTLEMLQAETRNRIMRRTLENIRETLDRGKSFSAALAEHPKVFDTLFVSVVEVGEYTGRLGPALEQMADMLEKDQEARQKAIQTMMYPVAIMGLSLVTMFVLITVALPPLLNVFKQMNADIPLMTRVAVIGAGVVQANLLKIPVGILVVVVLFSVLQRVRGVKYRMDWARTRVPVVGSFTVTGELARFARTISMLLDAGVSLSTALQLATSGCKNLVMRRAFEDGEESLVSGNGLAQALKQHSILPAMFVQLVAIGEESNSLKRSLADAGNAYQKQHDRLLDNVLGLLEPASTVFVGGIVGFIAFSMFLPIYSGLNAIG